MPAGSNANQKLNNRELTIMNKHMKIVVIGGSGLIGARLANNLRQHGQQILATSPASGFNTIAGEGLARRLQAPKSSLTMLAVTLSGVAMVQLISPKWPFVDGPH